MTQSDLIFILAIMTDIECVLSDIYFDVNNAACFSSVQSLYKEAKKKFLI
jgi:hypothetical protein